MDLTNFQFTKLGYGVYRVTYYTGRGDYYTNVIDDMTLIVNTHLSECAKSSDVKLLYNKVKSGAHYNSVGDKF